jgi:hypothetical protein
MDQNRISEIIKNIEDVQTLPWSSVFGAWGRKIRVDKLHEELDIMGYTGERPPRNWSQLKSHPKYKENDKMDL